MSLVVTILSLLGVWLLPILMAEELEMGMGGPSASERHSVDKITLAKFKKEYNSSQDEPRPIFEKYLPPLGSTALLDFLEDTYPACHGQAHDLGKALFAASKDLSAALRACGTRCTSGCMHGAVAEAFGTATPAAIQVQMNTFCKHGEMARLHKPGNCAHALGHALMFVNDGDVRRSVDGCLGFTSAPMQYYCATGVFMEKILTGPSLPSLSPYSPCAEETLFPTACYRYKAMELLDRLGTPLQLARGCLTLKPWQRRGCFHGLGHAVMEAVATEPSQLASLCRHGSRDDQIVCLEGAIEKLAEYDEERARTACASLTEDLQPVCKAAVADKMYSLTKTTLTLYYDTKKVAQRRAAVLKATKMTMAPTGRDYPQ